VSTGATTISAAEASKAADAPNAAGAPDAEAPTAEALTAAAVARRPLTERRMARTRRELADAAARLFIERGYDATTVEDIVAEVEISARTFFRYFGSKEEVVASLWRWGVEEIVATIRSVPADRSLQEALRAAVTTACQHGADNPATTRAFLLMVRNTPALRARRMQESYLQQQSLAASLGERLGRPADDLRITLMSGALVMAINIAFERWADQPQTVGDPGPAALVNKALAELTTPLLPA
jgi:AcrR family transcriptional regulator